MATQNVVEFLVKVSKNAAVDISPDDFLKSITGLIVDYLQADFVSITLIDPVDGTTFQVSKATSDPSSKSDGVRSFISRDLVVRRARYGHLEIRASSSEFQQKEYLLAFEVLSEIVARFAEIYTAQQKKHRLSVEIVELSNAVKQSKITSRVSNSLATVKHSNRLLVPGKPIPGGLYSGLSVNRNVRSGTRV